MIEGNSKGVRLLTTHRVDRVCYKLAMPTAKNPMAIVAEYVTDRGGELKEYIHVEGEGFARVRAEMWWAAHCPGWLPSTTMQAKAALERAVIAGTIRRPVEILVEQLPTQRFPSVASWRFEAMQDDFR